MGNSLLTGQREEAGIGLYYYGARWYDPGLARFIQPDTIVPNPGDAQSFDRYAYVHNNPLKYTDPTGHYEDQVIMTNLDCETWSCVEDNFAEGGRYAGLWGWLDVLRRAEDGDMISVYATNGDHGLLLSGQFDTVDGKIRVNSPLLSTGTAAGVSNGLGVAYTYQYNSAFDDLAFANFARGYGSAAAHSAFYANRGKLSSYATQYADCQHHDCATQTLDAVSTASAAVAVGCAASGFAPCVPVAGGISTAVSGAGAVWGAYNVISGNGTVLDETVTMTTLRLGAKYGTKANAYVGLTVSLFQWGWDSFVAPRENGQ